MDSELVDRARRGDREAFADIVDAIDDRSYEIARRILGESHLAQDAPATSQGQRLRAKAASAIKHLGIRASGPSSATTHPAWRRRCLDPAWAGPAGRP